MYPINLITEKLLHSFNTITPVSLLLTLPFLLLPLLLLLLSLKPTTSSPRLPPGTLGPPLIGETLDFLRCFRENRAADFIATRVAKHGDVFKTSFLVDRIVVIASAAGNKFVFSNENKLVNVKWPASVTAVLGNNSLISMTGARATRIRHALMTFLHRDALRRYAGHVDACVREFIASQFRGRDTVVFFPAMKSLTFSIACKLFVSRSSDEELRSLGKPFTVMIKGLFSIPVAFPGSAYAKSLAAADMLRRRLQPWIDERRRDMEAGKVSADQDMLSCLLSYRDAESGSALSDEEIKDNLLVVLFAGHDTSSCVLTFACRFLALFPHIQQQVYEENKEIAYSKEPNEPLSWSHIQRMNFTWQVVQESMRLQPPIQGAFRVTLQDIEYNGFKIPKSWKIYWSVHSTCKNPEYFEKPNEFNPAHFDGGGPPPYTFIPFGGGSRNCPGNEFARMEILIFLHHFVTRFRFSLKDSNEPITMDPMPFPKNGLPIHLEERSD